MNYQNQPVQGLSLQINSPRPSISRDAFLKDLRKKIAFIIIGLGVLNILIIGVMLLLASLVGLSFNPIGNLEQNTGKYFSFSAPADWNRTDEENYSSYEYVDDSGIVVSRIEVIATTSSPKYKNTTQQETLKAYISDDAFLVEKSLADNPTVNCNLATSYTNHASQVGFVRNCTTKTNNGTIRSQIAVLSIYDEETIWYIAEAVDPYWSENSLQFQEILSSLKVSQ
jgi:hypothetical protein